MQLIKKQSLSKRFAAMTDRWVCRRTRCLLGVIVTTICHTERPDTVRPTASNLSINQSYIYSGISTQLRVA